MSPGPVAVIDIGSNSIKILVASRAEDGALRQHFSHSIEARISAGLARLTPLLSDAGMQSGVEAICSLLAAAAEHGPRATVLVATSAVRDARNGGEFCARVRAATGHPVRMLSGTEEANLIGRGLTSDPALRGIRDFYVFDLGGGSLECLAFRDRTIAQAVSLPLGCVRLTEKFIRDPALPLAEADRAAVASHARATLAASVFGFSLPAGARVVGSGGTAATARAILGARAGRSFETTDPLLAVIELEQMLAWLSRLPLTERRQIPGLPAPRADVFPVALTTLIAVAAAGGFPAYHNSLYNLRFGVADETLT